MCNLCKEAEEINVALEGMKMAMLAKILIIPMSDMFLNGRDLPELSERIVEHSRRTGEVFSALKKILNDIRSGCGSAQKAMLHKEFLPVKEEVKVLLDVKNFLKEVA